MAQPPADDPSERFLDRVRRASQRVLGDSALGAEVQQLCDDYAARRHSITTARVADAAVIAVVGATGQGKTWLMRALVHEPSVREALRSGDLAEQRTTGLTWVGPEPPTRLDARHERFLPCAPDAMQRLGTDYLLLDTPGASDADPAVAALARRALAMAAVHLLVVRRDQLRSAVADAVATAGEGTIVLPVVTAASAPGDAVRPDLEQLVASLRARAPASEVLAPVVVPDFDRTGAAESDVAAAAAHEIAARLQPQFAVGGGPARRVRMRLHAAEKRFREELSEHLAGQLPGLARAVQQLETAAEALPGEVAEALIGSGTALELGIRARLRLALLGDTAAIWFPYRTLLGLLNLTGGAWDRLVLALSGSLPSLVAVGWQSRKNLDQLGEISGRASADVTGRAAALVRDRLRPHLAAFRRQLRSLRPRDMAPDEEASGAPGEGPAFLAGIDALQAASLRIVETEVRRHALVGWRAQGLGLIGTALFWLLLAGPIVSLYHQYLGASYDSLAEFASDLERFPRPTAAMLLTSLLLSLLPTAIFSMFVVTCAQRRGRVRRCAEAITEAHRREIRQLRESEILRLELDDPMLEDARFLLSVGQSRPPAADD